MERGHHRAHGRDQGRLALLGRRPVRGLVAAAHERVLQIEIDGYDNRVLTGGPEDLNARDLRRAIRASDVLHATLPELKIRTLPRA